MKKNKSVAISIVLPVYNEEKMIKKVVISADIAVKEIANKYEILVINDTSTDKTKEILNSLRIKHLKVIDHKKNLGIEKTLKELYNKAKYNFIFFNGADGDIDMDVLLKLYKKMSYTNADIVVGNRIIKNYSMKRKVISIAYNKLVKILVGIDVYDAGTVKLVKRFFFSNINVDSESVFAEAERLVRAIKMGAKLEKVDIKQNMIEANDAVDYEEVFLSFIDLVRLAFKVRTGKL